MATLLNSANFNGKNGTHFKLNLYYDYSQSIENNQTTITYSLYMQSLDGYSGSGATATGYINGSSVGTFSSIGKNTSILIGTKNAVVNHNNDGTFPSTAYSASIDTPWTLGDASVSGNLTGLPTIPRASSITATSANIGSASTITITPKATGFTHTLTYKFAGQSSETTIVSKTSNTSVSFTLPQSLYSLIPNSTSITGTIYCYTYKNNNQVGDKTSVNITGNAVFNDCKPNITNYTYIVDASSAELADSTTFIKNVTTATIRIWAERRQYSTLKLVGLYYVENGQIKSIVTQAINTTSGTFELQLSPSQVRAGVYVGVQDSRGYIHYEGTIPSRVIDYIPLTADQSAQIARTNQTEAKVKITQFKGNYWNGNFRTNNPNTLEIKWRYAETTGAYSPYYTIPSSSITISNNTYTISNYVLTDGTTDELFDYQKAYYIEFRVIDKVTQEYPPDKYSTYTITAGIPNFVVFPDRAMVNNKKVMVKPDVSISPSTEMSSSTSGTWYKVCNIKITQHTQGEFCFLRLYIGDGQNGRTNQNAYIDITMQLGWTGQNGGRFGVNAELNPLETNFNFGNTNLKVLANSNIDYDVWFYTTKAYCRVNYIGEGSERCTFTDTFLQQTTEPIGTECNLSYKYDGSEIGSINNGADHYIKHSNGIMECYGFLSGTYNVSSAFGNGYFYEFASYHNYAQTFLWAPQLNVNVYATSGLYSYSINGNTTTGFKGYVWTCRSTNNQTLSVHYHATGYWK